MCSGFRSVAPVGAGAPGFTAISAGWGLVLLWADAGMSCGRAVANGTGRFVLPVRSFRKDLTKGFRWRLSAAAGRGIADNSKKRASSTQKTTLGRGCKNEQCASGA